MSRTVIVWLVVLGTVGFEYFALNFMPQLSFLTHLQKTGVIDADLEISPKPGRIVSLWLGWIGLGLMTIMNLYSMRKRFSFMQSWGKLSYWMEFHVLCGLIGPTLILFHSNFKVRGLVGISFWSMMISFTSGIIGRYFYTQMLRDKVQFQTLAAQIEKRLKDVLNKKLDYFDEIQYESIKKKALVFVGLPNNFNGQINPFLAMFYSVVGDFKLLYSRPKTAKGWPFKTKFLLKEYAVYHRRALFLSAFQKLMGYWHSFHLPFAIFMYVVAVIHVVTALLLGV